MAVNIVKHSDEGKPDFFQNPGSGSIPGFNLKNPGFPVPKVNPEKYPFSRYI